MRTIGAAVVLLASTPAFAGWNLDARTGLTSGVDVDGVAPIQVTTNTAVSPFAVGPQLEIVVVSDFGSDSALGRTGLGVRQDLIGGLSVAGHALMLSHYGSEVGHASRSGLEGVVNLELVEFKGLGLGLQGAAGASPQRREDPLWWAGGGLVVRWGASGGRATRRARGRSSRAPSPPRSSR